MNRYPFSSPHTSPHTSCLPAGGAEAGPHRQGLAPSPARLHAAQPGPRGAERGGPGLGHGGALRRRPPTPRFLPRLCARGGRRVAPPALVPAAPGGAGPRLWRHARAQRAVGGRTGQCRWVPCVAVGWSWGAGDGRGGGVTQGPEHADRWVDAGRGRGTVAGRRPSALCP